MAWAMMVRAEPFKEAASSRIDQELQRIGKGMTT
jgi:hypothetical protein